MVMDVIDILGFDFLLDGNDVDEVCFVVDDDDDDKAKLREEESLLLLSLGR